MCRSFHQSAPRSWSSSERAPARPYRPAASAAATSAGPVVSGDTMRVSDAERHAVIDVLRRHTSEGRLTLDEFETRTDEALHARTGAELRAVLRELPVDADDSSPRRRTREPLPPFVRSIAVLVAVVGAISLAVGHLVVWPLFVFGFWTFGCGAKPHHRASHDRSDDERVERRDDDLTLV